MLLCLSAWAQDGQRSSQEKTSRLLLPPWGLERVSCLTMATGTTLLTL